MIERESFLSARFPVLKYFSMRRGPSTTFNESFHYFNANKKLHVNVWWRDDNTVSLSVCDKREENAFKQIKSIIEHSEKASMRKIIQTLYEVMSDLRSSVVTF